MSESYPIVFLVDVDDTLLETDRFETDLTRHIEREFGIQCRDRYWAIQEQLFNELGYRAYPPADIAVERISDLLSFNLSDMGGNRLAAGKRAAMN
jgi:hypothetical protein